MELLHQSEDIIAERYRIVTTLGQGGIGTTYEAEDLQSYKRVALKALSLNRMTDWKVLDLFEREARVLSHLNHPAIPKYLNHFQVNTPQNHCFYLVQELAPGKSLAALIEGGWRADEGEVKHLAMQILEILCYLHSLTPPVIHRDIKPQNIIRQADGKVFLVDFGAVQDTYRHTLSRGSTVVGTYGYMAPEQFRGQAVPATDLYGLGATLLFVLTHRSPAELPQRQLKADFRSQVQISVQLVDWLETMLEPAVEERFPSVNSALSVLQDKQRMIKSRTKRHRRPAGSRISLTTIEERLLVDILPAGWQPILSSNWDKGDDESVFVNLDTIFLMTFILSLGVAAGYPFLNIPFGNFRLIVSSFFWVIATLFFPRRILFCLAGNTRLEITRQNFQLQWMCLGLKYQVQGLTEDIKRLELSSLKRIDRMYKDDACLALILRGTRNHYFGLFLTQQERVWLVEEVTAFIKDLR